MRDMVDFYGFLEGVNYCCAEETLYIDVRAFRASAGILPSAGAHDGVVVQAYLSFRHTHPTFAVRQVVIKGDPK